MKDILSLSRLLLSHSPAEFMWIYQSFCFYLECAISHLKREKETASAIPVISFLSKCPVRAGLCQKNTGRLCLYNSFCLCRRAFLSIATNVTNTWNCSLVQCFSPSVDCLVHCSMASSPANKWTLCPFGPMTKVTKKYWGFILAREPAARIQKWSEERENEIGTLSFHSDCLYISPKLTSFLSRNTSPHGFSFSLSHSKINNSFVTDWANTQHHT